jgi:hypothetical protein
MRIPNPVRWLSDRSARFAEDFRRMLGVPRHQDRVLGLPEPSRKPLPNTVINPTTPSRGVVLRSTSHHVTPADVKGVSRRDDIVNPGIVRPVAVARGDK